MVKSCLQEATCDHFSIGKSWPFRNGHARKELSPPLPSSGILLRFQVLSWVSSLKRRVWSTQSQKKPWSLGDLAHPEHPAPWQLSSSFVHLASVFRDEQVGWMTPCQFLLGFCSIFSFLMVLNVRWNTAESRASPGWRTLQDCCCDQNPGAPSHQPIAGWWMSSKTCPTCGKALMSKLNWSTLWNICRVEHPNVFDIIWMVERNPNHQLISASSHDIHYFGWVSTILLMVQDFGTIHR